MKENLKIERLENEAVVLRQTTQGDFEELYSLGGEREIWEQHSNTDRYKKDEFREYFNSGIESEFGSLTLIDKSDDRVVGWTRLYDFEESTLSIRLGYTFIGRKYWGTRINYQSKKLLLDYLFEFLENVYFDVYEGNIRSQKAVMKLGAVLSTHVGSKHEYILTKEAWVGGN